MSRLGRGTGGSGGTRGAAVLARTAFAAALGAALALAACGTAYAIPPLMERAVLPYTPALPTSACAVTLPEGEQLIVGLADGRLVDFQKSQAGVLDRTILLPGSGAVEALIACSVPRQRGGGSESVILAVRGQELVSIAYGDLRVAGRVRLPAPAGRYRLAKAVPADGAGRAERAVVYDDDSAGVVSVAVSSFAPTVEWKIENSPELSVTQLSDRVIGATNRRVTEFVAEPGGVRPPIDERIDLADEPLLLAVGPGVGAKELVLRASDRDSIWVGRRKSFRDSIAVVASVSDTVIAVGGGMALTPSHDIGWVALVDVAGRVFASTDHASPVTNITPVGEFVAVQGGDRNLSVYDSHLNLLWDHDSPVGNVTLLEGNFAGDAAIDLAVVGTRTFEVGSALVDSIRMYLDEPKFMDGATVRDGVYVLERAFITFYVSHALELETTLTEGIRNAADEFDAGDVGAALTHATEARAAAAALGRADDVRTLTGQIRDYVSFPKRRRAALLSSLVLALLGGWVALGCMRCWLTVRSSGLAAAALLAAGAASWAVLGATGLNPLLLLGGVAAAICAAESKLRPGTVRRKVSGATLEELIRGLMEFLHGAGEGVPSDGVVDAARKSVTKVAYLAQEMSDSMDDADRYQMLRERFRSRGEDFLDTTYPRVAVLLTLARRTGFLVSEVEQMSRAADRMRAAIRTVLSDALPDARVVKQQLEALREGRDALASAADRAWAIVQANPGCSLMQSVGRMVREKRDELEDAGVSVDVRHGVSPEQDAVALWSFQFRFILENLFTNAIRAMRDSRTTTITIETATRGSRCELRFTDTGCGMTAERAAEIFVPKSEQGDHGRGVLSSVELLRDAGGDFAVERTTPGQGTTFLLTIPHWTPHRGGHDA